MIFISPKMFFISEYVNRRTTSINHIFNFVHLWKTLSTKIGHNFWELPGKFEWRIPKNYLTRIHQWPKIYFMLYPSALSKNFWTCSKNFGCVQNFGLVQKKFGHVQKFWTHLFLQILSISSNFAPHSNFLDTSKKFECVQNFLTTFKIFLNVFKNFGRSRWTGH